MHIPLSGAKAQLEDLLRRAAAGEEVVLTVGAGQTVRLVPGGVSRRTPSAEGKGAALERIMKEARRSPASPGPSAARSQLPG
ncbi:MAG TPA: type II toxin-antitoxin system prevent-host-death family antitoxin [Azospirillaceae bacterium]|nr:type II toxin-antitoxin system prevent-host-death family antitoxin [Azospirillaceae bacterium]